MSVVIVDNGGGNLSSVRYALARLGVEALVSAEPDTVRRASHVVLPGVGAAADAMARLRAKGLDALLPTLRQPVLGICLGMQLLHDASAEGDCDCLGILPGRVTRLEPAALPVPHMGWNQLQALQPAHPLLAGLAPEAYVYFVHSYAVAVGPHTVASCDYAGDFAAVVSKGNFHGCQFHPERSAAVGARLLKNFLTLDSHSWN